jgi:hypothetical protein
MEQKRSDVGGQPFAFILAAVISLSLTAIFWSKLWEGAGIVGGDIYAYYLPQKAFYAECLREGTLPIWNNRIGNGYPQLAESQTGVFYPLNLLLYRWLDLNTAINTTILFHYWLAFVGCWLVARRLRLGMVAALLAALVYTYGWFPARITLEWAIIGGAWLPLAVWCAESFLQQGRRLWLFALSLVLALQLLAGHFQIAFLTQLLLVGYVPARLWFASRDLPEMVQEARRSNCLRFLAAICVAFLLAAVQILPTWELKTRSQRSDVNGEHDPSFGVVPAVYLSQVVAPWIWYPDKDAFPGLFEESQRSRVNRVDAHLYFGLIPLALIVAGVWLAWRNGRAGSALQSVSTKKPATDAISERRPGQVDHRLWFVWLAMGIAAVLYMPGWFLPVTRYLPGFNFFQGPGRYGIIATLSAALLAGVGYQGINSSIRRLARPIFGAAVLGLTLVDLLWVCDKVLDVAFFDNPPVKQIANSTLRRTMTADETTGPARILSEGYNVPSILGVGTLPVYLGLSPSPYYDSKLAMPKPPPFRDLLPTPEQLDWMNRMGVTHVLSVVPLDSDVWPIQSLGQRPDPFLNPVFVMSPTQTLFLYEFTKTRGRVAWQDGGSDPAPRIVKYLPNVVEVAAKSASGGTLILTDLAYPGWSVAVDGRKAEPLVIEGMLRGVAVPAGEHTIVWTYSPTSLNAGAAVSLAVLCGGLICAWVARRRSA